MNRPCSIKNCDEKHYAKGFCSIHYRQTPEYKENARAYYEKNKKTIKKNVAKWQKDNPERYHRSTRDRNYKRKHRVMSYYSKKQSNSEIPCCSCCGENKFLIFLTIDHIRGRKFTDDYMTPKSKKSSRNSRMGIRGNLLYVKLERENFPSGYRVLCWNCNSARDNEVDKICPHERGKQ